MSSEIEKEFLVELNPAAGPLLKLGLYDSPGEFIKDVTSDFIKHKIQFYKKQLKKFKRLTDIADVFKQTTYIH